MIIQHNIPALNSYNKLSTNNSAVQKNLEKLSSGYRINRAGDDAAGLAISEKMRAQITGLERAKLNAQDGISLVQTAEGALTEVHSMLNRLVELGTESANGIYQAEDREKIQSEVDQIIEEVDRISKATNFNGIKLLDGSLSSTGGSSAVSGGQKVTVVQSDIASMKTGIQDQAATSGVYQTDVKGTTVTGKKIAKDNSFEVTINYTDADGSAQSKTLNIKATADIDSDAKYADAIKDAVNADEDLKKLFTAAIDGTVTSQVNFTANQAGTAGAKIDSIKFGREFDGTGTVVDGNFNSNVINAATSTPAADKTSKDVIIFDNVTGGGAATNAIAAGKTITIGDKTYEFVAQGGDTMKVGKGNIAVNMGANDDTTLKNLVSALQSNGVKSATFDATGDGTNAGIKIGDLNEIKAVETKANITTTSNGIKVSDTAATNGVAKFTASEAASGTDGKDAYLEINYIDEEGKEQTTKVKYTASKTATTNADNIAKAIAADEKLSKLFTATTDATNADQVVLTSVTAGANGAKVTGVKTTDPASPSVDNLQTTTLGRDKGQTVSIDAAKLANGDTLSVNGKTFQFVEADKLDTVKEGNIGVLIDSTSNVNTAANLNLAFQQNGVNLEYNAGTNSFYVSSEANSESTGGLTLQIGDTADDFNKVTVSVDDMSAKGLGIDGLQVTDQGLAADSISAVKGAIEKVSVNRGRLGALQNRLEHTINNLATTTENMTAAESRIRDTDMAKEMMNFTKNNVLVQAAQAMLAQANQQPQQVLQLLR